MARDDLSSPRTHLPGLAAAFAVWAAVVLFSPQSAAAPASSGAWSLNAGWHNPVQALMGFNVQYLGPTFGFEAGLGWADVQRDEDQRRTSLSLLGGANMKYLFMDGWFRPFAEIGLTLSNNYYVGWNTGFDLSSGPAFLGAGVITGSPDIYGYFSALYWNGKPWGQIGIGYGF